MGHGDDDRRQRGQQGRRDEEAQDDGGADRARQRQAQEAVLGLGGEVDAEHEEPGHQQRVDDRVGGVDEGAGREGVRREQAGDGGQQRRVAQDVGAQALARRLARAAPERGADGQAGDVEHRPGDKAVPGDRGPEVFRAQQTTTTISAPVDARGSRRTRDPTRYAAAPTIASTT